MKISSNINNKNQEVVISANPEQLKLLGEWLITQSEEMSKNLGQYSHEHIKGAIQTWHKKWPDIIVHNSRSSL